MSLNPVIVAVLENEGAYVNHPDDPGGPTHWGITEKTARDYGYTGDMKEFTRDQAYAILEKNYWYQPGFDKVYAISPALALELCDTGTNMGHPLVLSGYSAGSTPTINKVDIILTLT